VRILSRFSRIWWWRLRSCCLLPHWYRWERPTSLTISSVIRRGPAGHISSPCVRHAATHGWAPAWSA